VWPLASRAQQPAARVHRVGYLTIASRQQQLHLIEAFEEGLRSLGHRVGENVAIEYRFANGQLERLPALAADLVRLGVDVIVTGANPNTVAAMKATRTIPIVMTNSIDPVGAGLIASLARPGGNVTGFAQDAGGELNGKRLELLKETLPNLSRVGILWNPGVASNLASSFKEFAEAGLLLTYGANVRDLFRRSADFVDKIFRGAKPVDLPVEQPTKFEMVVNLKTAKALGLIIPSALLSRADEVIE
jgi:ABC-type uncharacterized transport system substrate-binding protein